VRERVALLLDDGSFAEEALLAGAGRRTGSAPRASSPASGTVDGRPVAVMANDPTVKAGSWAPKTVEKILRIQERALTLMVPIVYLVDSAGARITEQVQMFPGGARGQDLLQPGALSGVVPQVCVLFGPSAAGGAYIPAFCDVVIMRDGNASMYLGSPRMAEMVIGEKVTLEEMGGARMHTSSQRLRAHPGRKRRGGHRARQALPVLPPDQLGAEPARRGARAGAAPASDARSRRSSRPTMRTSRSTCESCSTACSTPARCSRSTSAGRRS
jgi:acetyl-CoA carboxylase carboxyltransferase component